MALESEEFPFGNTLAAPERVFEYAKVEEWQVSRRRPHDRRTTSLGLRNAVKFVLHASEYALGLCDRPKA